MSRERRYFVGSHKEADAEKIGNLIRAHWQVESGLHWHLDVNFDEAHSLVRIGNAAGNLFRVRRIALVLLKKEMTAKVGVQGKRLMAAWDRQYLLRVLSA